MSKAPSQRKAASKTILHNYQLSTEERCWFQSLMTLYGDENVQCASSADPVINNLSRQYRHQQKKVAVYSIDSDLHSTTLANIDVFIWQPKSLYSTTILHISQQELLQHYRRVFSIKNNIDDTRLVDLLQDCRLLAGI